MQLERFFIVDLMDIHDHLFFDNTKVKHFFYLQNIIDIMFLVSIVYFFFRGIFLTYESKKILLLLKYFTRRKRLCSCANKFVVSIVDMFKGLVAIGCISVMCFF